MNHFEVIPVELLINIVIYDETGRMLYTCMKLCKRVRDLLKHDTVHKTIYSIIIPEKFQKDIIINPYRIVLKECLYYLHITMYHLRKNFMKFLFSRYVEVSHRYSCTMHELLNEFNKFTNNGFSKLPISTYYDDCFSYMKDTPKNQIIVYKLKKYCNAIRVVHGRYLTYDWPINNQRITGIRPNIC